MAGEIKLKCYIKESNSQRELRSRITDREVHLVNLDPSRSSILLEFMEGGRTVKVPQHGEGYIMAIGIVVEEDDDKIIFDVCVPDGSLLYCPRLGAKFQTIL